MELGFGPVADTVNTTVSTAEFSATDVVYSSSANTGGTTSLT